MDAALREGAVGREFGDAEDGYDSMEDFVVASGSGPRNLTRREGERESGTLIAAPSRARATDSFRCRLTLPSSRISLPFALLSPPTPPDHMQCKPGRDYGKLKSVLSRYMGGQWGSRAPAPPPTQPPLPGPHPKPGRGSADAGDADIDIEAADAAAAGAAAGAGAAAAGLGEAAAAGAEFEGGGRPAAGALELRQVSIYSQAFVIGGTSQQKRRAILVPIEEPGATLQ